MKNWLDKDKYFVAEIDQEIVRVVGAGFKHGAYKLMHMVDAENHRRQGIGNALIAAVIQEAQKQGAVKVWLDTLPFLNAAKSLYENNGFMKCGHIRKHLWNLDLELYELLFE